VNRHSYKPELFPAARLAAADFDQTVAATFVPAPSGIGVHEAYDHAIDAVFGPATVGRFHTNGGLRNRAASEVVRELFPDMSIGEVRTYAEQIIHRKLAVMLGQIDDRWPKPTDGFTACWNNIARAKEHGAAVDTAIISAGYAPFIEKTFGTWGLPQPDILITTEIINDPALPESPDQRNKPAPLSMRLAIDRWIRLYHGILESPPAIAEAAKQVTYIGDDPYKDGRLAEHFGIPFVLIEPDTAAESWRIFSARLGIGALLVRESIKYDDGRK
jgi:hypothetical protein